MIQSSEKDLYHSFEVDVRKKGVVVHGGFIWMSQCDSSQTHLSFLDPCSSPLGLTTELCRWPLSLSPLNLFPRGSVDGSALLNHGIFILSSSICRRKFLSSQENTIWWIVLSSEPLSVSVRVKCYAFSPNFLGVEETTSRRSLAIYFPPVSWFEWEREVVNERK